MQSKAPKSLESEKACLGAALMDPSSAAIVSSSLCEADFTDPSNKLIFASIKRLFDAGKPIDAAIVIDEMTLAKTLEDVPDWDGYFLELGNSILSASNVDFYVKQVRGCSKLSRFLRTASKAARDFDADGADDPEAFIAAELSSITAAAQGGGEESFVPASEAAQKAAAIMDSASKDGLIGLSTGFKDLDAATHGFEGGSLIVIGGRTAMGKSAIAVNLAWNASLQGKAVAFFSFEMPFVQLAQRLIASVGVVPLADVRTGHLSAKDREKAAAAVRRISASKILFGGDRSRRLGGIVSDVERLKASRPDLGLVIVDYIGLVSDPGKENRENEVASVTRSLKELAMSTGLPIVALAQLNRDSESNDGSIPTLVNLRESGAIEQDADIVILLHRKAYYETRRKGVPEDPITEESLILAKNRNGPLSTVRLVYNRSFQAFSDEASDADSRAAGELQKGRGAAIAPPED